MTEAVQSGVGADAPISMPWSAPVFPPPPHSWVGVQSIVFPYVPNADVASAILPPGVELTPGPGLIVLLNYPASDIQHPFKECVVTLPVRVGEVEGNYVPYIYVTTDEALIPGRELGGFPKKLADVVWERDGNRITASVTRFGERLLELEGEIAGPLPESMADMQAEASKRPSINYKLIPGPDGSIEIEEVTSTPIEIVAHQMEMGNATLQTHQVDGDPVAALVPSGAGIAVVTLSDNTIPAGSVLVRVERKNQA